jgi:hypothetical protein
MMITKLILFKKVQFKTCFGSFYSWLPDMFALGEFVIVAADRGEDLGVVTDFYSMRTLVSKSNNDKELLKSNFRLSSIIRIASLVERTQLVHKYLDEQEIIAVKIINHCNKIIYFYYHCRSQQTK